MLISNVFWPSSRCSLCSAKLLPVRELYLAFVTNFLVRSSIRLLFFSLEEESQRVVDACSVNVKLRDINCDISVFFVHWHLRLLGIRHTFTVPCPRFWLLSSGASKLRCCTLQLQEVTTCSPCCSQYQVFASKQVIYINAIWLSFLLYDRQSLKDGFTFFQVMAPTWTVNSLFVQKCI